ncbi:MAG: hypothetical protein C0P77_013325 [Thermoanaerobacterales bacterium]|nr:hypothetical protein [Thermoanaerobacterales bacterium]
MVDTLMRAWRAVRRPADRGSAAAGLQGPLPGRRDGRLRLRGDVRWCGASGWQLRPGCGDGAGTAICPVCGRRVRTQRSTVGRYGVEVIEAHGV